MHYRLLEPNDNSILAEIIRDNLKSHNLDIGGIGLAELDFMDDTAELQKLYLTDAAKGQGLSYKLIELVEDAAINKGYKRMYLETHTNLKTAIHVYEKCGYKLIERPKEVVHSSMNRFYLKELS